MTEPLVKPSHLASPADEPWLAKRKFALVALVLGVLSFIVVAIAHGELSSTPDWKVTLPGFAATAIASLVSLARREPGGYWLWAIGLGLAAATLVLGWFLMIAIIVAATAVVIVILHAVM